MDEKEDIREKKERKGKKKTYNFKIEITKLIVIVLILIFSSIAVYYFFFHTTSCKDEQCFSEAFVECKKAEWINDGKEATWLYTIIDKRKGRCEVDVQLLQAKKGKIDLIALESKNMICSLPLGTFMVPEQNLKYCHGLLKEALQDLTIKRMHSYLLENLETINQEIIGNLSGNASSGL